MNLQKKADRAYQEWGRRKYKKCLICPKPLSCLHHYYPKSTSSALRYDEDNGIPICAGHHLRHHCGDPSVHNSINEIRGKAWLTALKKKKEIYVKPNKKYYETIIKYYAEKDNG